MSAGLTEEQAVIGEMALEFPQTRRPVPAVFRSMNRDTAMPDTVFSGLLRSF
jgi:hypothetical protein